MRRVSVALGLAVIAVTGVAYMAVAENDLAEARLVTSAGSHDLRVELARTPQQRETGLMNRESMPEDHGMLFEFDEARPVTMWMKNTLIPLDMLFLDEAGVVENVKTNAQPLSLDLIPSGTPVKYVLELNGGAASSYGVSIGDRLETDIIPKS